MKWQVGFVAIAYFLFVLGVLRDAPRNKPIFASKYVLGAITLLICICIF
jgi:hypothetical protein